MSVCIWKKWAQWGVVSVKQFFWGPGGTQTVEIWSRSGVSRNHDGLATRPATEKHKQNGAAETVTNMCHSLSFGCPVRRGVSFWSCG